MTITQKLIQDNLILRNALQNAANWITVDKELSEGDFPNEAGAEDFIAYLLKIVDDTMPNDPDQLDLFPGEKQNILEVETVRVSMMELEQRITNTRKNINHITKESLILNLSMAENITQELIVDLKANDLRK